MPTPPAALVLILCTSCAFPIAPGEGALHGIRAGVSRVVDYEVDDRPFLFIPFPSTETADDAAGAILAWDARTPHGYGFNFAIRQTRLDFVDTHGAQRKSFVTEASVGARVFPMSIQGRRRVEPFLSADIFGMVPLDSSEDILVVGVAGSAGVLAWLTQSWSVEAQARRAWGWEYLLFGDRDITSTRYEFATTIWF